MIEEKKCGFTWLTKINLDGTYLAREGLESELVKRFNLYSIPSNYLLDKTVLLSQRQY
jgi:hypothetical protein